MKLNRIIQRKKYNQKNNEILITIKVNYNNIKVITS